VVSLHAHSWFSRETLEFLPGLAGKVPILSRLFEGRLAKYAETHGRPLDLSRTYWRPPLVPHQVVDSETAFVERRFELPAVVALTDHDTIAGSAALRTSAAPASSCSLEWTVPWGGTTLHLGVHNLPSSKSGQIVAALNAFTRAPRDEVLVNLLEWLLEPPETFVVVNHPLWDLDEIGGARHEAALLAFLRVHGGRLHALELNGYRQWSENRRVLPIAAGFALPVVAAGDRHGSAPSALLTLSAATSLAEFGCDLRKGRHPVCVMMPEYREPFVGRILDGVRDALRNHAAHPFGAVKWLDRVFLIEPGGDVPLSAMWPSGGPMWMRGLVALTRVMGARPLLPVYRLARPAEGPA
jgi:hypothetical protein